MESGGDMEQRRERGEEHLDAPEVGSRWEGTSHRILSNINVPEADNDQEERGFGGTAVKSPWSSVIRGSPFIGKYTRVRN